MPDKIVKAKVISSDLIQAKQLFPLYTNKICYPFNYCGIINIHGGFYGFHCQ